MHPQGGRTLPQVRGCLLHGLADASIPSPTRPGALKTLHRGIHKRSGLAEFERKKQERGIIPEVRITHRA